MPLNEGGDLEVQRLTRISRMRRFLRKTAFVDVQQTGQKRTSAGGRGVAFAKVVRRADDADLENGRDSLRRWRSKGSGG